MHSRERLPPRTRKTGAFRGPRRLCHPFIPGRRIFDFPISARGLKFLFVFRFGVLHPMRDDDLHPDLLVEWLYIVVVGAVMENADYSFLFALGNAEDPALAFALGP